MRGNFLKANIITVDFGGTKILSALLDRNNEIINRVKIPTDASKGADKMVASIAEAVLQVIKRNSLTEQNVKAVSLGVPGTVNPYTGLVENAPNIGMKDYNIKDALQKYFSIPVLIENDVNLAALGIKKFEFDDNVNNMLVVFVGTGIGSALILNGNLYRGSSYFAGEIGHMLVTKKGELGASQGFSFEKIASRTAVVESIQKDIEKGKKSVLREVIEKGKKIKSKALSNAVMEDDKIAVKHVTNACSVIGSVLGSITTLLNIDTIVLGGGVIEAMGSFMMPKIKTAFEQSVWEGPGKIVKIVETKLGDDAPLYGGFGLAEEFLKD